jgi:hypothetical protein
MDASALGLGEFNEKDRKEIQSFIEKEQQKAKFQESAFSLPLQCSPPVVILTMPK